MLLHWVVSLRINQFGLVSKIDPNWKKSRLYDSPGNKRPRTSKSKDQRWSPRGRPWPRGRPRGQILKSLALASRPQVLENWPVLGSRTALFFELLKFCEALEKFFGKRVFVEIARKNFCEDLFFFFFWRTPKKFL